MTQAEIINFEPSEMEYKPDDDQLAIMLAEDWQNKVRYFHDGWHVYENGCWTERQQPEVNLQARKFLRTFRKQGIKVSKRQVTSVVSMAEDDCFVPDRELVEHQKAQKRYINLRNGLFDLETMELTDHKPGLFFTNQLGFDFDEDAHCPTFHKFLRTSLRDESGEPDGTMIALVEEALAYSMTARTDLKASFWLVGKPDSGKSTLLRLISDLMGELHTTVDLNQLGANRFLLSGILGKRCVTFSEASASTILPDALYKAMVGGTDEIYVDRKNRDAVSFVPEAKFWWAMNESPRITDRSGATFNRLNVIIFNRTVPANERIYDLSQQLRAERDGIFSHLMNAYKRLIRRGGFPVPGVSRDWKENYRRENDTELSFLEERCVPAHDKRVQSQTLYDAYKTWCERNGFRPKNINQVHKDWERLGLQKAASMGVKYWHGVKLRENVQM